jgi:phosphate:Na+ symporter
VRDLRRISAHIAMVAHPMLERRGELLPSRLSPESVPENLPQHDAGQTGQAA